MADGVENPASSASCHPFLRSTGLSHPLRYAWTRSLVSDRAKQGPMRSQMLLNRLVHNSSGDKNDEGASTFIGSLLPFLFFLLSSHTYHCSTRRAAVIFSSPKIEVQSPKRKLVVTMMETRSYRSEQNWNKLCAPSVLKGMKPTSSKTTRSCLRTGVMNLERRNSFPAAKRSFTSPAAPKKRTFLPCLHAQRASPLAMWVLPNPGFPIRMMDSLCAR